MAAVHLRGRRRTGRHLRRLNLRALRLVRRQYLTGISACILGAAFVVALTSSSLDGPAESRNAAAPPQAAFIPWPTATPGVMQIAPTPAPMSRLLVYYVVEDETQQAELEMAVQSDQRMRTQLGLSIQDGRTFRYFLVVRNARDEAEARIMLNDLAVLAPDQGYRLRVVDMR